MLYKEPMITDEGGFKNKLFKHIYYFQLSFFLKFKQICSKIELQKLFKTPSFETLGKVDANIPVIIVICNIYSFFHFHCIIKSIILINNE